MRSFIITLLLVLVSATACSQQTEKPLAGPVEVATALLEAYNSGDLDGIVALYDDTASLYVMPSTTAVYTGKAAIREAYSDQLERNCLGTLRQPCPDLNGRIVSYQTVGQYVTTVELVTLDASNPPLFYMITYQVSQGRILNAWFMADAG